MSWHIQGPWQATKKTGYDFESFIIIETVNQHGWEIADVRCDVPCAGANANLIAAAPELFEALEAAMKFIDSHVADPDITQEMASAWYQLNGLNPHGAIAKAKGEQA